MDISAYLTEIRDLYRTDRTTEHSFRPALERLFKSIDPTLTVINEPRRIVDVGAVDFVIQRGDVAIGWCEAKDIGKDIKKFAPNDYSKAQKERYLKAFPNLIYTNGLDFEFIRDGAMIDFVTIADLIPTLPARPDSFATLRLRLEEFAQATPLSVTSSKRLAEMMAARAGLIKDIMGNALVADLKAKDEGDPPTDLIGQYEAFKANLIHEITVAEFADIYAETIAYGLFAARLHDETQDTFSRAEALELLPKSNPFLRELFIYIAGPNLDERLRRTVDDLCAVFLATDMPVVLRHFGKVTRQQDPFLHFYEVFLAEYNPAKRKARGVWYTPEPVVNFIVRAVDEVLKTEFGLADGLADTSRIAIDWDTGQTGKDGKPATIRKEVHRVQILDPATGTGTFLAEVVKLVAERVKGIAPGQWSQYVERDLIPRIHGFELLMASYAMCHMKLDMILTGLGYKPTDKAPRLGVYLTNTLEEGERVEQTLPFMGLQRAIAEESKLASDIKRQTPIMCVIGNPPYSIQSGNLAPEQVALVDKYRSVDGLRIKEKGMLQFEKNINNDYIKFISFVENVIQKNGSGVFGYITSHGYLKSGSFRGLRSHLLDVFDSIRIIDLHGNSEIRESPPIGITDQNVFDIKQGVAIIIAIKRSTFATSSKGDVSFAELWGTRQAKYNALWEEAALGIEWIPCHAKRPNYIFHPSGPAFDLYTESASSLPELMPIYSSGIITARDGFSISENEAELEARAVHFGSSNATSDSEFCRELNVANKKGWDISKARRRMRSFDEKRDLIKGISYRPFDNRKILFDESVVWTTARVTMDHMLQGGNVCMVSARADKSGSCSHFYVSDRLVETKCGERTTQSAVFPLYLYPDEQDLDQSIRINFDPKLYAKIRTAAGLTGKAAAPDSAMVESGAFRTATGDARPDEVKVFDYIYGVLHCPAYRETYAEFLKIDFPRVPFPPSPAVFRTISEQGEALRRLHLMEDAAIGPALYPFHGEGDSVVDKPRFEPQPDGGTQALGRVYINGKGTEGQYFDNVPPVSWGFPIGGYQPAQKWLKDRKGRALSYDDIRHYQKIIKILAQTDRIMAGIEMPLGEGAGDT